MPVGKIYAAIKNGVNNGNMASYAAQIPVDDRWAIVAYIRAAEGQGPVVASPAASSRVVVVRRRTRPRAEHGTQLYKAKGCNACHTLDGTKIVGPTFKGLWGKTEKSPAPATSWSTRRTSPSRSCSRWRRSSTATRRRCRPRPLTDLEVESLVLFIETLK